jgi:hypothetical protein
LVYYYYAVEFQQQKLLEEDDSKECRSYPNEKFQRYGQCDAEIETEFHTGSMPVLSTDDVTLDQNLFWKL